MCRRWWCFWDYYFRKSFLVRDRSAYRKVTSPYYLVVRVELPRTPDPADLHPNGVCRFSTTAVGVAKREWQATDPLQFLKGLPDLCLLGGNNATYLFNAAKTPIQHQTGRLTQFVRSGTTTVRSQTNTNGRRSRFVTASCEKAASLLPLLPPQPFGCCTRTPTSTRAPGKHTAFMRSPLSTTPHLRLAPEDSCNPAWLKRLSA